MSKKEPISDEELNKNEETENNTSSADAETLDQVNEAVENNENTDNVEPQSDDQRYLELHNKYIRLYSDFDNFRKRSIKEKADNINSASADVMKDLLVILDDFERAVANNEKVEDTTTLKEGFKLIQHKLILILQQKGLEAIEAKGEVFDADKHEAITNVAVQDEDQKGKVIDVVERGYNLRGKALRYAKVIVGQ